MKRYALKIISILVIVSAIGLYYQQQQRPTYSLVSQLNHYGWGTPAHKEALQYLMQKAEILKADESLEQHYPERVSKQELVADLVDLIDQTQAHFFRRGDDLERWEVTTGKWMNEDLLELQKHLRILGLIDEVSPQHQRPDAVCVLGASYARIAKRIKHLEGLLEKGFKPQTLILLAGERYVTVGVDGTEAELQEIAAEFSLNDYKMLTETHMIKKAYQDSTLFGKFPLFVIDTPRGEERRPTTPMTIRELNDFLQNHQDLKHIVFISNQPYVKYQEGMIRAVLKNMGSTITFEVIGNAVQQPDVTRPLIEGVGSHIYTSSPDIIGALGVNINDPQLVAILDRHYQKNPELYERLKMMQNINLSATAYIDFMRRVGAGQVDDLSRYFSSNVKKVENGKTLITGFEGLKEQLSSAQIAAAPWYMKILDVLTDQDKNAAAVRFVWDSEQIGKYTTMVMLKFDDAGKITEINEVYNKFVG